MRVTFAPTRPGHLAPDLTCLLGASFDALDQTIIIPLDVLGVAPELSATPQDAHFPVLAVNQPRTVELTLFNPTDSSVRFVLEEDCGEDVEVAFRPAEV